MEGREGLTWPTGLLSAEGGKGRSVVMKGREWCSGKGVV